MIGWLMGLVVCGWFTGRFVKPAVFFPAERAYNLWHPLCH